MTLLQEVSEIMIPPLAQRLSRDSAKKLGTESSDDRKRAIAKLAAWLSEAMPESVINDGTVDLLELVAYCSDLLKEQPPKGHRKNNFTDWAQ